MILTKIHCVDYRYYNIKSWDSKYKSQYCRFLVEWDFFEYRNLVRSLCAMFPPKCYFGGSMNKGVVVKRRKALERYFKSVLSVKELSNDLFTCFHFVN